MLFRTNIFLALCLVLSSCYDNKTQVDENEDIGFEGNVTAQEERDEISIGEGMLFEALTMDNEGLKVIENALRRTGLDTVLNQGGPYTLFAPSDAAFARWEEKSVGYAFIPDSIDTEEMRNILLHHVVKGNYSDTEIANQESLEPMYGDALKILTKDGKLTVDSASIAFGDFAAENGYIHIIDDVLLPD